MPVPCFNHNQQKNSKIKLLSADDIRTKYSINSPKNKTIWMVDNDFVKRVANFRIDSAYLYKIRLEELPATDGSAKDVPGYTIIRLYTRTAENINRFTTLRIRGSNTE
ncbi:MAG: hypothetical protein V4450_09745 [Bacteroidota bacterium]